MLNAFVEGSYMAGYSDKKDICRSCEWQMLLLLLLKHALQSVTCNLLSMCGSKSFELGPFSLRDQWDDTCTGRL